VTDRTPSETAYDWLINLRGEQQSGQLMAGRCHLDVDRRTAEDLPWA
jgi:hypothetical protein